MKIISIFNNKGGVGKTTLTFHLACALSEMGKKTLLIDLDPQCSLTIHGMDQDELHAIWKAEDPFIDDFKSAKDSITNTKFKRIATSIRSIHFLLASSKEFVGKFGFG